MPTSTIHLHRVFKAPPERVYRAFLEPEALVRWMAPYGFTAKVHSIDARVGGGYRMSFTNFGTGTTHSFGGTYKELVPNERIHYTDRFDDPTHFSTLAIQSRHRSHVGGPGMVEGTLTSYTATALEGTAELLYGTLPGGAR